MSTWMDLNKLVQWTYAFYYVILVGRDGTWYAESVTIMYERIYLSYGYIVSRGDGRPSAWVRRDETQYLHTAINDYLSIAIQLQYATYNTWLPFVLLAWKFLKIYYYLYEKNLDFVTFVHWIFCYLNICYYLSCLYLNMVFFYTNWLHAKCFFYVNVGFVYAAVWCIWKLLMLSVYGNSIQLAVCHE